MKEESPTVVKNTTPKATQTAVIADDGEPKSYLAMMLLASFVMPSGLARVYRGDESGKIRFWIWIAATVLMIIPFVNILAGLAMLVLYVWGVVDFFNLYKTKTDATGRALHTTVRDAKAAKILFILVIIGLALTGVLLILAIVMFGFIVTSFQNAFDDSSPHTNYDDSHMRMPQTDFYN